MTENEQMQSLADRMYRFTGDLIAEGNAAFAVAAVHTMIALQIYKSSLSEEEYNKMVDSISMSRDKVKSLLDMVNEPFLRSFH